MEINERDFFFLVVIKLKQFWITMIGILVGIEDISSTMQMTAIWSRAKFDEGVKVQRAAHHFLLSWLKMDLSDSYLASTRNRRPPAAG